jgi:hypothetical protein
VAAILTPEEFPARLKVRKTWVYEQSLSLNWKDKPGFPQVCCFFEFAAAESRPPSQTSPEKLVVARPCRGSMIALLAQHNAPRSNAFPRRLK